MPVAHPPGCTRCAGFTLTESLVAVGILATLTAIAVPSWESAAHGMKLSAISSALFSQLHLARSEAIKRNARVALCQSADGTSCAGNGRWEQGWIVFHDADNNGVRDAGEAVLDRFARLPEGWRLSANGPLESYISYSPVGGSRTTTGAFQAGTLTLCRASGAIAEGREIVLNALGRPRIRKVRVDSCP